MNMIVQYLVEFSIYLFAFYFLYLIAFKDKTDFGFNRIYLVSSMILAVLIPFIPIHIYETTFSGFDILLSPVQIGANGVSNIISANQTILPIADILMIIYFLITALFILRSLWGFKEIFSLRSGGSTKTSQGIDYIINTDITSPFSFFNLIYLPKKTYSAEELQLVLEHEKAHISFKHSYEKIFLLAIKAFFWWHPISYRYFDELELVHEYQVDQFLGQRASKKEYSLFLLKFLSIDHSYSFVNNISSQIKKRIIMLGNKKQNPKKIMKWGTYIGMICTILLVHACNIDDPEQSILDENYADPLKKESAEFENFTLLDTIYTFDTETKKETITLQESQEKVYKKPTVMPVFSGCDHFTDKDARKECSDQNMLTFIYSNLLYPEEARANGVEGMAVAQFIIDTEGKVRNPKIVRELGSGTNEAILKVLHKMNEDGIKWVPGRNEGEIVAVKFTLPVKFKLEG